MYLHDFAILGDFENLKMEAFTGKIYSGLGARLRELCLLLGEGIRRPVRIINKYRIGMSLKSPKMTANGESTWGKTFYFVPVS